jgi:predicted PurR-regulated permease PerM
MWMFQGMEPDKRQRITAAGAAALLRVGGFLRGTTLRSGLIAITDLVFMALLGVPLAVPLAVLVFLAGYIPTFGPIVASATILLVALGAVGPAGALALLGLIVVRDLVLRSMVQPRIPGQTVSIHPALELLVLAAGYELAGIIGLFAAVPVTVIVLAVASAVVDILNPDQRPPLPALVPAWIDRVAQWSWRLLLSLGLVALAVLIATRLPLVTIPALIALILAATLEPIVQALLRRGHTRGRAAGITVGGGFLLVAAILVVTLVVLVDRAGEVGSTVTAGAQSLSSNLGNQLDLGTEAVTAGALTAVQALLSLVQGALAAGAIIGISALLTFYFLKDGPALWDRFIGRVRPDVAPELDAAGTRAIDVLGGYMFGTAAISFVGAASQLVIMLILGIPLALPVFVLSFILCFIPYIGGFISTGIAFLLTVAAGSPLDVAIMAIWTVVFNIVQGNVVSPIVYGRTVHLHPAIVLVAIPAASAVAGILGMFIVVPVLGIVAATWRTVMGLLEVRRRPDAAVTPVTPASEAAPAPG